MLTGKAITARTSLLFLDEFQSAPETLAALRYFHDEVPELRAAAAGSPMEVALSDKRFTRPVERVAYPIWGHPQSNGIVERFHRTLFDDHFRVEGRRTWFKTTDEMQAVLDKYLVTYNRKRPHPGHEMSGRSPWQAFLATAVLLLSPAKRLI